MIQLYTVTATADNYGTVLEEIFTDLDEALAFELRIDEVLRKTYNDKMADDPSLQTGFSVRKLHEQGNFDDNNLFNGGWAEDRVD